MAEVAWKNFLFEDFLILNFNHGLVFTPSDGIWVFWVLNKRKSYLHYFFNLLYERSFHLCVFSKSKIFIMMCILFRNSKYKITIEIFHIPVLKLASWNKVFYLFWLSSKVLLRESFNLYAIQLVFNDNSLFQIYRKFLWKLYKYCLKIPNKIQLFSIETGHFPSTTLVCVPLLIFID